MNARKMTGIATPIAILVACERPLDEMFDVFELLLPLPLLPLPLLPLPLLPLPLLPLPLLLLPATAAPTGRIKPPSTPGGVVLELESAAAAL